MNEYVGASGRLKHPAETFHFIKMILVFSLKVENLHEFLVVGVVVVGDVRDVREAKKKAFDESFN